MADLRKKYAGFFSDEQYDQLYNEFKAFDLDGNGSIDAKEFQTIMKNFGMTFTDAEVKRQIAEVDLDKSGTVEWGEFLEVVKSLVTGKGNSTFGANVQKASKGIQKVVTASGGAHSFSEEEKVSFVDHINSSLQGNPLVKHLLPLNPNDNSLFPACKDGLLLCALINDAVKDTIDVRALNTGNLNTFKETENLNVAINSAKGIGCSVINIGARDIQSGTEHIILGLIWQIIRIGLLSSITLANHPELFRLLEPGETIEDLLKLSPEQILLRWFNYHLKKAGSPKRVNNFSGDIKDSEAYTILLNQLVPEKCDKSPLNTSDLNERAKKVLDNADKIGCRKFVKPSDIVKGNAKLNLAFVANLFNTYPGLEKLTQEELAALEEWLFASEGTREARAFCLWINSLGVEPFVNNLFEDLRDGLVLLRVMDAVNPGIVDWSKVNTKLPLNTYKKIENCNYAVVLGKQMKFSLVGIGGQDISAGNKTLTLAIVWQLMRFHVLSVLKSLGPNVNDEFMIKWANDRVASSGKSTKMRDFKDPSLKNSHFFLDLLNTIRKCVNYELVTPGDKNEDAMQNAKYCISIARKLGCTIFLLPEDIVEVRSKLILTLVGSIMAVAINNPSQ
jgi:plastin-1